MSTAVSSWAVHTVRQSDDDAEGYYAAKNGRSQISADFVIGLCQKWEENVHSISTSPNVRRKKNGKKWFEKPIAETKIHKVFTKFHKTLPKFIHIENLFWTDQNSNSDSNPNSNSNPKPIEIRCRIIPCKNHPLVKSWMFENANNTLLSLANKRMGLCVLDFDNGEWKQQDIQFIRLLCTVENALPLQLNPCHSIRLHKKVKRKTRMEHRKRACSIAEAWFECLWTRKYINLCQWVHVKT